MLYSDAPMSEIMGVIVNKLDELLIQAGRKEKEG